MLWVVDCSFAAALFLPDESSLKVESFFRDTGSDDLFWVPMLWWYEITNVLVVSERRNRLTHADIQEIMLLFDQFEFNTDNSFGTDHSNKLYEVAQKYTLSSYDASYLELAVRKSANLASLDNKLIESAKKAGVKIYE